MKNAKNVILNSLSLVLGVLILVFLAMPHYVLDLTVTSQTANGYDLLNFEGSSLSIFIDVSLLFMIIFASLLILASIGGLLSNFGVVRGKTFAKASRMIALVSSILLALFAMFALAGIGYDAATATKFNIGDQVFDVGEIIPLSAGWGVIVNFILALAILVCEVFNKMKVTKAKGKRK